MRSKTIAFCLLFSTLLLEKGAAQISPDSLLLADFRPRSIFKIPKTDIQKAAFSAIDMHGHPYCKTEIEVEKWVKTMDECGIEKTVILTGQVGKAFDETVALYQKWPDRFDFWCGIDFNGSELAGWAEKVLAELERCKKAGATGIGEITDKGRGLYSANENRPNPSGIHADDPKMAPIWAKCADLGLPINIHIAEPIWMFEAQDKTNDGLMNAFTWRIDYAQPDQIRYDALIKTFEKTLERTPRNTWITCHLLNLEYDLGRLGGLLERFPNLFADIGARYSEVAATPRFTQNFLEKWAGRICFGTDMGTDASMYRVCFRILESADEHFYEPELFTYHWPLHGFALSKKAKKGIYRGAALRVIDSKSDSKSGSKNGSKTSKK